MKRSLAIGGAALALVLGASLWNSGATVAPTSLPNGAALAQDDAAEIDTSSIVEMTLGNADAKVQVVEYASFSCPHCATFHTNQFKQLKADYIDTGKVHFTYRDVFFNPPGLWGSLVARCAGPEKFFGITDMIYAQQGEWMANHQDPVAMADGLRKIGKVAGLEEDALEACLADGDKARTLVAWYKENAEKDDVDSTPTLIINGKQHSNMSYADLKGVIDGLLGE